MAKRAAKKEVIREHLDLMHRSGVKPVVVDIDSFALMNCFEAGGYQEPGSAVAVINVGADITSINVLRDGRSSFTREIGVAGKRLTEAVQKASGVDFREAERRKRASGEGAGETAVSAALAPVIDDIAGEIRLSLDYCESLAAGSSVSRAYLSGGSSKMAGLSDTLARSLGVPVKSWDPLRALLQQPSSGNGRALREAAPLLGVAIGLAMRTEAF